MWTQNSEKMKLDEKRCKAIIMSYALSIIRFLFIYLVIFILIFVT